MLQLKYLRENKEAVLKALEKRNFKEVELIDDLLDLDETRRKTQMDLDQQLAEANGLTKEVGQLFKNIVIFIMILTIYKLTLWKKI